MSDRDYPQTGDYIEASVTVRGRVERKDGHNWFWVRTEPGREDWAFEDEEVDLGEWKFTKITAPVGGGS